MSEASKPPVGSAVPDHADVIAPPPVIYAAFFLLGVVLHTFTPLRMLSATSARLAGAAVLIASLILLLVAHREFGRAGTSVMPQRPTTAIIRGGLYRHSRNPLYIGLSLFYVGAALLLNSLWALLLLAPALVVMSYGVIAREERYLERKFGREYLDYKAAVRRWL